MLAVSQHTYSHRPDGHANGQQSHDHWMPHYGPDGVPHAPTFGEHPLHQGRTTETTSTFDSPQETTRPRKPEPPAFALTTQLMLAGLTASLVVALGLLFTQRQTPQPAAPPQVVTVELMRQNDAPRPEPAREISREPAPKPEPRETSPGAPAMPDPSTLADTMGYLFVKGPNPTDVYLNGVRRGATNEALMVPCGQFFLRLAPPNSGRYPAWTTSGEHAFVACKSSTVLSTKPPPPPPLQANVRRSVGL